MCYRQLVLLELSGNSTEESVTAHLYSTIAQGKHSCYSGEVVESHNPDVAGRLNQVKGFGSVVSGSSCCTSQKAVQGLDAGSQCYLKGPRTLKTLTKQG